MNDNKVLNMQSPPSSFVMACRGPILRRFVVAFVVVAICVLAGCESAGARKKTTTGVMLGAVAGALLGAAVGGEDGAAIGALVGAGLGGAIGAKLDADDQLKRQAAFDSAAEQPRGGIASWSSPDKGTGGQIVKVSNTYLVDGRRCMEVEETVTIAGEPRVVKDMQCEDASGTWVAANF